jgi:hypothetical protein
MRFVFYSIDAHETVSTNLDRVHNCTSQSEVRERQFGHEKALALQQSTIRHGHQLLDPDRKVETGIAWLRKMANQERENHQRLE